MLHPPSRAPKPSACRAQRLGCGADRWPPVGPRRPATPKKDDCQPQPLPSTIGFPRVLAHMENTSIMFRNLKPSGSRRVAGAAVTWTIVFVLAACGPSHANSSTTDGSGHSKPNPSSLSQEKEAIASGWRAGLEADDVALRNSDPTNPMLAATHTGPQLSRVVANLRADRLNGWIGVGTDHIRSIDVTEVAGRTARVTACMEGDEIEVDASTMKPVPGVPGQKGPVSFHALMTRTSGGWKIEQQSAVEGPCTSS